MGCGCHDGVQLKPINQLEDLLVLQGTRIKSQETKIKRQYCEMCAACLKDSFFYNMYVL